jgi:hypothetical protein
MSPKFPHFFPLRAARPLTTAAGLLLSGVLWALPAPAIAVDLLDHGPVWALGFAEKNSQDMALISLGWRWRFDAGPKVNGWFDKIGTDFTWLVEPMAAAIVGDENSGEFQVVPQLHFEPASLQGRAAVPYLEGGIGLMYTGLDGLGLGSNILFSDNVGVGLRFPGTAWSVGYRYRHISHAGLWADSNSGMNTHYLTVTWAINAFTANRRATD